MKKEFNIDDVEIRRVKRRRPRERILDALDSLIPNTGFIDKQQINAIWKKINEDGNIFYSLKYLIPK